MAWYNGSDIYQRNAEGVRNAEYHISNLSMREIISRRQASACNEEKLTKCFIITNNAKPHNVAWYWKVGTGRFIKFDTLRGDL